MTMLHYEGPTKDATLTDVHLRSISPITEMTLSDTITADTLKVAEDAATGITERMLVTAAEMGTSTESITAAEILSKKPVDLSPKNRKQRRQAAKKAKADLHSQAKHMHGDKVVYTCDPTKNTECTQACCVHNPNATTKTCAHTRNKKFAVDPSKPLYAKQLIKEKMQHEN